MVLDAQSLAAHNKMLGQKVSHPKSTKWDDDDNDDQRPLKRQRRAGPENSTFDGARILSPLKATVEETLDPDGEAEDGDHVDKPDVVHQTDLEFALPSIRTDKEAIEEYETRRAAETNDAKDLHERLGARMWTRGKNSIYVDAFNLALVTVLDEESHLFNETELALFQHWRALSYEAQYLYVRLFLRKTSAWHRINKLGYYGDISDMTAPIEELQTTRSLPRSADNTLHTPGELQTPEGTTLGSDFTFADSSEQEVTTLDEASSLLKLDELKGIAKVAKVQGKNKKELLKALRRSSSRQGGLSWVPLQRSDTEESIRSYGSGLEPDSGETSQKSAVEAGISRDSHFVNKILNETGPCIRLSIGPLKLFERVHLVFYRSTEWTEKSLTTIILARIARRNFPKYIVSRSTNIFPSRSLLLEFEASLRTQFRIDSMLEFNGTPTRDELKSVLNIFEEVLPRWRVLRKEEQHKEDRVYETGEGAYLRRLSPAWVYTRIIHKGTSVLAKFKEHKREHKVLTELLEQRLFHHARRGAWYQRKALLEEHYMAALSSCDGRNEEAQRRHWKRVALRTCEDALQDHLVHLIYHHDLQKRVTKLEKSLKVVKREQHDFGHVRLAKPLERTVYGVRIERGPSVDSLGRRNSEQGRRGAKTIWLDTREGGGECSVEAMCLSWYRDQGYKGYHSEGGIVRTLFAYLLYDVLFTYLPNVFQTEYQTCPLDLHSDAFFPSRMSEINRRLVEIGNGEAESLVRSVWEEQHEKKTCVVGLDWSFDIDDVVEVVNCFDGEALATVCKVMAQEYGQRGAGSQICSSGA